MSLRDLTQLIEREEPAWPLVQRWIADAKNSVEVLPTDRGRAESVLHAVQVTTRSPMGAVAYETGGISVDRGWVRILGAGGPRMDGDLAAWNGLGANAILARIEGAFLVAHDVLGGFFALNGGALGPARGNVFYFAPDSLEWEDMQGGYSQFLGWLFAGDLAGYYGDYRWPGWEDDVRALSFDRGFSIYPFLWTKEGRDVAAQSRRPVPMKELWGIWQARRGGGAP